MSNTKPSQLAAYSDLFDRLLDSSLLLEFETLKIIDANPAAERLFQTTAILQKTLLDLSDPTQKDLILKNIRMSKRRYYPHQFECPWKISETNAKLMQISACILKLSNNTEVIQIIAKDITAERELEQKSKAYLDFL
ncbi:MAG: hypothetical protein HY072_03305 [Deltaproteobacteria bacterium]|nr:hypothetical protein [Deltaproteobacteria bacterium]